ncbi:acylphosphatase [Dehalococcoidia bacterium]|nr:acylphosphatase [Dehalococcoidia bacterium]MCL0080167.1 acylphosphatase [Dehalococcoidia bacterium]MCL0098032.1 acylphosphatase [Dehalococcoidia bacterium]
MDDMAERASLSVRVHGLVQGVYFRSFVQRQARTLGLTGCVRNLPDGVTVEILAEGDREKLEELAKRLEVGPPEARVDRIEVAWSEYRDLFGDFRIRH